MWEPDPSSPTRLVSGIRNAEMKWTSPEKLDVYGVRLVGWPPAIPAQNPSTLKTNQNKLLLDSLENGTMRFERIIVPSGSTEPIGHSNIPAGGSFDGQGDIDFSWAYDADGGNHSVCFRLMMFLFNSRIYFRQNTSQDFTPNQSWDYSFSTFNANIPPITPGINSGDGNASLLTTLEYDHSTVQVPSSRKRPRREG